MAYKTSELAKLAGISSRTLRFYDQVDLLKPKRDNSNYRYYDSEDVDKLQQILLFKEMGLELSEIKKLMSTMNQEMRISLLNKQLEELHCRKKKLDKLILNVKNTINALKGEIKMSDQEKFEGLKDNLIKQNDEAYKDEVIEKWGKDAYEKSRKQFKNMTEEQFKRFTNLDQEIKNTLVLIKEDKNNASLHKKVAELHKEWITLAWGYYDRNAHLNLADMYVQDERFTKYYDQYGEGFAKTLRDAIHKYL